MNLKNIERKVPSLRFPEFDGEWTQKKGGEITSKITKGSSPSWQGFSYQNEGVLFITSENVRDGYLDVSRPKFLPQKFYEKQRNSQLAYGDILINIVGASIGRNCLYLLKDKAFTNQAVAMFRTNIENSFSFISFCYQQDKIQRVVSGTQSESARPNLSLADLKSLKFRIPALPEQQKIADFLTAVDKRIEQLEEKKRLLTEYKKGVMQQIFSQQIRFKDDNGNPYPDWQEKQLGDVVSVKTGNKDTQNKVASGKYPFIVRSNNVERINSYSYDGEAILTSGDGVGVGKNYHYIIGKFDYHQRVYCLSNFSINLCGKYLFYYFSISFYRRVMRLSAKNSVDSVRRDMIVDMPIPMGAVEEQQKIADFLTTIDNKIEQVALQLGQAKTFKKGLLQQMFV